MSAIKLRDWTLSAGTEPLVRVGIVTAGDGFSGIRLRLTAERRRLYVLGDSDVHQSTTESELPPYAELEARGAGGRVVLCVNGIARTPAPGLRLLPPVDARQVLENGVIVADVVAGRGFHWEKRIDVTLSGVIEILPSGDDSILLINELPLEDYLAGVISAEMSGACPVEMLKAQCVAARSWLLAFGEPKHAHEPFDRCNDDCCQRYQGLGGLDDAARNAVAETRGLALLDVAGNVLDANYAKCCGGISETPESVWGASKPGLRAVVDAPSDAPEQQFFPITEANLDEYLDGPWLCDARCYCSPNCVTVAALKRYLGRVDELDDYFRWTVRYSRAELESVLAERLPELSEMRELLGLRVVGRGVSGRAERLEIRWCSNEDAEVMTPVEREYCIRQVLHRSFLYSSAFSIREERDLSGQLKSITLRGAGWGHGVGLCQIGALGMALAGSDFKTICQHYYPDAHMGRVYP